MSDGEVQLLGGRPSSGIVRVGDTVRRPLHPNSEFVHTLLRHFAATGFDGAPRLLGIDGEGREILGFVEGQVFVGPADVGDPVQLLSDEQLASAGRLIRRFHDATAGTPFAGDAEVVCHHDLGQHNIVFQGERAVAIIDWDEDVAPGPRLLDVSHAVWCLAEIGRQGGPVADQAYRVNVVCDSYGWDDRSAVIDAIEARFRRALVQAERDGRRAGVRIWRAMLDWLAENGAELKAHLQPPSG